MKEIVKKWNEIETDIKKYIKWVFFGIFSIVILYIFIYWYFDFVSIQSTGGVKEIKETNIQKFESAKLTLLIMTPILTLLLFFNTINVQKLNSKNLGKDSMSKDFYNLLSIFKQEQNNPNEEMKKLAKRIIKWTQLIESNHQKIKFIDEDLEKYSLEEKQYILYCPNYLAMVLNYSDEKFRSKQNLLTTINNQYVEIGVFYEKYYPETGTYFRLFHRLIKLINDRYENRIISTEERKMYIGILRAQLSSDEMIIVLVNSLETYRGIGLGVELIGSSFFGDLIDIEVNQHFKCPGVYVEQLQKYFVDSHNAAVERKEFKLKFNGTRAELKKFDDLINGIDKKRLEQNSIFE